MVIPASWIAAATRQVLLRVGHQEAASRPEFERADYRHPDVGWEPPYPYERGDVLLDGHLPARRSGRSDVWRGPTKHVEDILAALDGPSLADRRQTSLAELLPERRVPILTGRGGERPVA